MKRVIILLALFMLCVPASALTITPDGPTHVVITPGTTYNFSYTADGLISGSSFYLDGEEDIIYQSYKEYTFHYPDGAHNVSVISYDWDHYAPSNMVTYVVEVSYLSLDPAGGTHVVIPPGTTYNFSYTTNFGISTSDFYLDGVKTVTPNTYQEYTFHLPGEYHNVSVVGNGYNVSSEMLSYNVLVQRTLASTPIETFNETEYNLITEHISDEDYEGLMDDSTKPFIYILGRLFYLILFVLPYGLMWMKQQSLTIPVVLSLLLGSLFIGFVPEQYKSIIIIAIALSYGYNLYLITRER